MASVPSGSRKRVERFIENLGSSYLYSVEEESTGRLLTLWTYPTKVEPVPDPVVYVEFRVNGRGEISFRLENQLSWYSSQEIEFDNLIEGILRNKRTVKKMEL